MQQRTKIGMIAVCAFTFLCVGIAQAAPVKIAERTPVKVRLLQTLTSGKAQEGQAVEFEVRDKVLGPNGELLAGVGAKASGKVTLSKKRGMLGKSGKLEFTVDSMQAVDGTQVPLRANLENSGKDNQNVVIASALLLSVFAVFVNGQDITVKEGTELLAYVDRDTMVDPAKAIPGAPGLDTAPAVVSQLVPSTPPAPVAKFSVVSQFATGSHVMGEIKNVGEQASGAEVVVFIKKDGNIVGAGSAEIPSIAAGEKHAFNVLIEGSTKGTVSIDVNAK